MKEFQLFDSLPCHACRQRLGDSVPRAAASMGCHGMLPQEEAAHVLTGLEAHAG